MFQLQLLHTLIYIYIHFITEIYTFLHLYIVTYVRNIAMHNQEFYLRLCVAQTHAKLYSVVYDSYMTNHGYA